MLKNPSVFFAAFEGAQAGMAASLRTPSDPNPTSKFNVQITAIAGSYALQFDTVWGTRTTTGYDLAAIQGLSAQAWGDKAPSLDVLITGLDPETYAPLVNAIIALVVSGDNYLASQGIASPTRVDTWTFSNATSGVTGAVAACQKSVTPRITGKLRVCFTGSVQNNSGGIGGNIRVHPSIEADQGVNTFFFEPSDVTIVDNGTGDAFAAIAVTVDWDELPPGTVFDIGTPVRMTGIVEPVGLTEGQAIQFATRGLQMSIIEKLS